MPEAKARRFINMAEINFYKNWLPSEKIPVIGGYHVEDVMKLKLEPWARMGGTGAYLDLKGAEDCTGAYLCEIPAGKSLNPEKHLYEEMIYILSGKGSCTIRNNKGAQATFEWGEGTLFAPPLNASHQLKNTGSQPARFLAVTGAPVFMNLFHNLDFIFNNDFDFTDRYSGSFSDKGTYFMVSSPAWQVAHPVWQTDIVRDVPHFQLEEIPAMGKGFHQINLELADNTMEAHITEYDIGSYKKAHRHDGGAHILIVSGTGYELMEHDQDAYYQTRFDFRKGSILVPPDMWWHQHFFTGTERSRQLALRWHGKKYLYGRRFGFDKDIKKGGDQIEYADEPAEVRRMFEAALARDGLKSTMPDSIYKKA